MFQQLLSDWLTAVSSTSNPISLDLLRSWKLLLPPLSWNNGKQSSWSWITSIFFLFTSWLDSAACFLPLSASLRKEFKGHSNRPMCWFWSNFDNKCSRISTILSLSVNQHKKTNYSGPLALKKNWNLWNFDAKKTKPEGILQSMGVLRWMTQRKKRAPGDSDVRGWSVFSPAVCSISYKLKRFGTERIWGWRWEKALFTITGCWKLLFFFLSAVLM